MSQGTTIRSFDYVNHPYQQVREFLARDPGAVFQAATGAASDRAKDVASALRVDVAGLEVSANVSISIEHTEETSREAGSGPATRIRIGWKATNQPALFPIMRGVFSMYPLTATETQLDFAGSYTPPLGPLGMAVNALVGHRIAEASVHRFVHDVARHLRTELSRKADAE